MKTESEVIIFGVASALSVKNAAERLIKALDYTIPSWRKDTLVTDGDEVNDAWIELVQAVEGKI